MNAPRKLLLGVLATACLLSMTVFVKVAEAANYYVHPNGSDSAAGTLAAPWKTFRHVMVTAQITGGDTIYFRGGTYRETGISSDIYLWNGTAGAPITFKNYPNEVPILNGSYTDFETTPNTAWEVYDAARKIYRTVATYPMPSDGGVLIGAYLNTNKGLYTLISYADKAVNGAIVPGTAWQRLTSDIHEFRTDVIYYAGPGVYYNRAEQKIYARLQRPDANVIGGTELASITWNEDPRQTKLYITKGTYGLILNGQVNPVDYVNFEGIHFKNHGRYAIRMAGTRHANFTSITTDRGGLNFAGADFITVDKCRFEVRRAPWASWEDLKDGSADGAEGGAGIFNEAAGYATHDIEVKNSQFIGVHDGVSLLSSYNIYVHNNDFTDIMDDSVVLQTDNYQTEVAYNRFTDVCTGVSAHGNNASSPDPGTMWIHHNITKTGEIFEYRKRCSTPDTGCGLQGDPPLYGHHVPFGSHNIDRAAECAVKIYNNTVIYAKPMAGQAEGQAGWEEWGRQFDGVHRQEVYNNIFLCTGDNHVAAYAPLTTGKLIFDGNIYWRGVANPITPLFKLWKYDDDQVSPDDWKNFQSLALFKADPWRAETQTYYPPGWEYSGNEGDPQLGADFYPIPGGLAASGAVDLQSKGWPGYDGGTYRGALPSRVEETIALWAMTNLGDNIIHDSTLYGSDGALIGNAFFTPSGYSGDGLSLDGTNDGGLVTKAGPLLDMCDTSLTVSMRFKGDRTGPSWPIEYLLRNVDTGAGRFEVVRIGGRLDASIGDTYYYAPNAFPTDQNWHELVVVLERNSSVDYQMYFYVDGQLKADESNVFSGRKNLYAVGVTDQLMIGTFTQTAASFDGTIDEVRVLNYPQHPQ